MGAGAGLGALGALEALAEALEGLAGAARGRGAGFAGAPPGAGADAAVRGWAREELRPALEGLLAGGLLAELEALGAGAGTETAEKAAAGADPGGGAVVPGDSVTQVAPTDVLAVLDAFGGSSEEEDDDQLGYLSAFGVQFGANSPRGLPSNGLLPPALDSGADALQVISDADLANPVERPAGEVRRVTAPRAGGALGAMQKGMLGELGAVLKASGPKPGAIARKESAATEAPEWKRDLQKRKSFAAAGLPVGGAGAAAGEDGQEAPPPGPSKPAWKLELEKKQKQAAARGGAGSDASSATSAGALSAQPPAACQETDGTPSDVPAWKKDLQKRKSVAASHNSAEILASARAAGGTTAAVASAPNEGVPDWKAELQARSQHRGGAAGAGGGGGRALADIKSAPTNEAAEKSGGVVPKWKEELLAKQGKSPGPAAGGGKPAASEAGGDEPPWKKELRQRKSVVAGGGIGSPSAAAASDGAAAGDAAGELAAILQKRKDKAQT